MSITRKEVDHVARLARLELSEEEKNKYTDQLEKVLVFIEHLAKLNTDNIEPTSHALDLKNVWRKDESALSSEELKERILGNAPSRDGDFYKVKKVIE